MSEPNPSGLSDNAAGAIAYVTFVPALVFLILEPYNKSSFVRFHAWQSIFLNVAAFVISFILSIVLAFTLIFGVFIMLAITRLVWLAWLVVWIICVVNAANGKLYKLPILGDLAEKQANR